MKNAEKAAQLMVHIVRKGYELIIVHGNGPQVGNLLIQMEEAVTKIPPYSLDVCDAMTEGSMGYLLERAITNELRRLSIDKDVVTLVTQVLVDSNDPAFENPTKPVGPFYTKYRAQQLAREKKWAMVEDAGRGYRKVVPSPRPIDVVPKMDHPRPGRGGPDRHRRRRRRHPGVMNGRGLYEGVEAVIDKDYASSLIAREVKVDLFIILTGIDKVYRRFREARASGKRPSSPSRRRSAFSTRASSRRARWGRRSGPPSNTSRPEGGRS